MSSGEEREDIVRGAGECGANAAAYALGALDEREATVFERHLASCTVCRHELTEFEEVVEALPAVVAQFPAPRRLRRRVLNEFRAPRSAPPVPRPVRTRSRGTLAAGSMTALALICAAVLILVPGGASTRTIRAHVLASTGTAELKVGNGHAELIVDGMPQPASGHIYEVWLKRPHAAPAPTGALFGVTSKGAGVVEVPGDLADVREVLVTQEPDGGTSAPTSPAVIVARLSATGRLST